LEAKTSLTLPTVERQIKSQLVVPILIQATMDGVGTGSQSHLWWVWGAMASPYGTGVQP